MGWRGLTELGRDLLRIIFPEVCEVCGRSLVKGERVMCLHCDVSLPRTRVHTDDFNVIHKRLAGSTPIDRAAGMFYYYRESEYARLIHVAKYESRPVVARRLAEAYARELMPDRFFDGIEVILPVPLHSSKLISRGYNQSEEIAMGLSAVTGIVVGDNLVARRSHSTQTKKNSYSRWVNAQGVYDVDCGDDLEGKHVLVVDDVITTGATLLACCEAIHRVAPTARISVLSLAVTHLR